MKPAREQFAFRAITALSSHFIEWTDVAMSESESDMVVDGGRRQLNNVKDGDGWRRDPTAA